MTTGARCGVFGGTFNPIHVAHLRTAEEVAETLGLGTLRFVPSGDPPHKSQAQGDVLAPASLRARWVERAIAGNPRFQLDDRELLRDGPSYMVDTLRSLGEELGERPVFVIGLDAFLELGTWREPKALLTLADFAVMTRPQLVSAAQAPDAAIPGDGLRDCLRDWLPEELGPEVELAADGASARHRSAGTGIRVVPVTALDVSSSDIRRRLREGRSIRYLVPEAIHDAVRLSGAYGADGDATDEERRV